MRDIDDLGLSGILMSFAKTDMALLNCLMFSWKNFYQETHQ